MYNFIPLVQIKISPLPFTLPPSVSKPMYWFQSTFYIKDQGIMLGNLQNFNL